MLNKKNIFSSLLCACLIFIFGLGIATADPIPSNQTLNEDLLLPPDNNGNKIPISIAFRLINITDIDEVSQRFTVTGYLMAEWQDPRLAFKPKNAAEKFRLYRPEDIWIPKFDFANGVSPHQSFDIAVHVTPEGKVKYYERSSAILSSDFHIRSFPLDEQELTILIQPSISEVERVNFVLAPFVPFSDEKGAYSSLLQWDILKLDANIITILGYMNEPVNVIKFSIDIERRSNFYIWKVFLPLLLMVFLSWTVLWIDPKELSSQTQISVTTILTVIAFSFAISVTLPKVPYLTFIDAFFLLCYFFVFITAIEITLMHVLVRKKREASGYKVQRISQFLLPSLFLGMLLVIIWWFLFIKA